MCMHHDTHKEEVQLGAALPSAKSCVSLGTPLPLRMTDVRRHAADTLANVAEAAQFRGYAPFCF
jgi:hypothetical protein